MYNQNHREILLNTLWDGYKTVTSVSKDMDKMEISYTAGGNVIWCSHSEKQSGSSYMTQQFYT